MVWYHTTIPPAPCPLHHILVLSWVFVPIRSIHSNTQPNNTGLAVITGLDYPSRIAIQMLQDLYTDVMNKFPTEVATAVESGLTKKAKSILSASCAKYDDLNQVDKASSLLGKVDVVKSTMQDNIAGMLKNTEKAETLAEKSDQLNEQASVFKKKSTDLRKQMAWKNLKMTLLLGGIVIVILIVILAPIIKNLKKD